MHAQQAGAVHTRAIAADQRSDARAATAQGEQLPSGTAAAATAAAAAAAAAATVAAARAPAGGVPRQCRGGRGRRRQPRRQPAGDAQPAGAAAGRAVQAAHQPLPTVSALQLCRCLFAAQLCVGVLAVSGRRAPTDTLLSDQPLLCCCADAAAAAAPLVRPPPSPLPPTHTRAQVGGAGGAAGLPPARAVQLVYQPARDRQPGVLHGCHGPYAHV